MSSVVLHMDKFKREAVRGLQSHTQRERKSRSNPDIDYSRSDRNFDLYHEDRVNFSEIIDRRIDELELRKSPRHDAVFMCGLIVSSDQEFFQDLSEAETRRFFQVAKDWLENLVGRENAVAAVVHLDEATPHLHFLHVPVTPDGRLCANDIYTRTSLKQMQTALPACLQSQGFKIQRGVEQEPGAAKKHLNTREFKQEQEALAGLQGEAEQSRQDLATAQAELQVVTASLAKLEREVREAEEFLSKAPEAPRPTLLNFKSVCADLAKLVETQKKALTDKQAVARRNRELEARQKDFDSQLKVKELLANLEKNELLQTIAQARREIQTLAGEKIKLESALNQVQEFLTRPEVQELFTRFAARRAEAVPGRPVEARQKKAEKNEERKSLTLGR